MEKVEKDIYLNFEDVLIKPKLGFVNSRSEVNLNSDIYSKTNNQLFLNWNPIPIMSANMDTITNIEVAFELLKRNWIPVLHKYVSKEEITSLYDKIDEYNISINKEKKIDYRNLFISRGTSDLDKEKLKERLENEPRIKSVCIDVANGYRQEVFDYVKELRTSICKNKILMVGNIATPDAFIEYSKINVDIVKCGIGPGSVCTTRVQTGVGVPQISMILKIKEMIAKKELKTLLCSDGGCKVIGDISKAFVAGSDFVMLGGMLSGYKENPGIVEEIEGKKYKRFSGMAAKESQWNGVPSHGVHEGKTVMIPYRGKIINALTEIEGGVRSSCTYTNSENIDKLITEGVFIRTNVQENKVFNH